MDRLERVLGGLFGVACGDALGGTLEFTPEYIGVEKYGYHKEMIGGGKMHLEPGQVTDDTVMTIAVGEGIIEDPKSPIAAIGKRFVEWYKTDPIDIGITCQEAIDEFIHSGDWMEASLKVYKYSNGMNAGNGSLMRCIPVPLFYKDLDKMVEITKAQSDMTHYNVKASDACILYNKIIYKYLDGGDKLETIKEVVKGHEAYEKVFYMKKENLNPTGYVVDTLQCALWCFINNSNVEDIICEAVNLYGDPDTIGAIAGGLAGVYYGFNAIPERWREKIIVKERLSSLAEMLEKK
ncbi:ADP-ribosylglycohydrolase family protein [Clostridium estertheticum]|uniref:ADP-ribosylglycohydrolase family protein n=1 Tax=Clostridium estertheticum TaxID=238834 RepID=UPI001C7CB858|nr:ADP-ribosylglycohydrolase family protein [Clostridium estertheticum]MBX4271862.1 ADP-ribosylglycohydrolase family protein [Clostridium estertheticum]WLC78297.1 ADP-ribosylglycohydrolase family protein [Clostridium estertheticum]